MNWEERIERLEMELAHQQRTTDQLNQAVSEQSLDLLRLRRTIDRLAKRVDELATKSDTSEPLPDIVDEKPPHY